MPTRPPDPPPADSPPPERPLPAWATTLPATPQAHDLRHNLRPQPALLPLRLQQVVALLAAAGLAGMAVWFVAAGGFSGGLVAYDRAPQGSTGYSVDLNTASRVELLQLPRVGPALADRIIERRETSGPFTSVDELLDVPGIGAITLADLRPFLRPLPPPATPPGGSTDDVRPGQ